MLNIKLDPSAEEAGFASMLTDLMQQNVQQHPEREADFNALRGSIAIEARDAEVAVTMLFLGGELIVLGGVRGRPDVLISADSAAVLELSNVPLFLGLPALHAASGRAVVQKIASGELRLSGSGLILKPLLLPRFTKLLSVSLDADFSLAPGEELRFRTGLHWLWSFSIPVVASLFLFAWMTQVQHGERFAGLQIVGLAMWLFFIIRHCTAVFRVSNHRIFIRSALVRKRTMIIPLVDVARIEVDQCLIGRRFNAGKLTIRRLNGETTTFRHVARVTELRDVCVKAKG